FVDLLRTAFITQRNHSVVFLKLCQQYVLRIQDMAIAGRLQRQVNLSFDTDFFDPTFANIAWLNIIKNLIMIKQADITLIYNGVEAEIGLLRDQQTYLVTLFKFKVFIFHIIRYA